MMWDDDRMRMHDQNGGAWFMVILMLAVVFAVVIVVVALLRGTAPLTAAPSAGVVARGPDARATLRDRFARGEIDEQDFRARIRALDESGPAGG